MSKFNWLPVKALVGSALLCWVSTSVVSAKAKYQFSLEQLVEAKSVVEMTVSPDGKNFAYLQKVPRKTFVEDDGDAFTELYVSDRNGNTRAFILGKKRLGSIQWSPTGKFIYFISKRDNDKFASIYRIATDGGEAQKLVEAANDISAYTINNNESKLVYISKPGKDEHKDALQQKGFKAKVYEEAEDLKTAHLVELNQLSSPHTQLELAAHIMTVEFHPSKDQLLIKSAPSSLVDDSYVSSQYQIVKVNGRSISQFKTEGKLGMARWSPDGKYVAIVGAQDKHDPATGRLFLAESRTGKIRELNKNYQGQVKDIQWLSDFQLAYLGHVGTKSEVSAINIDSETVTPKIGFGEEVLHSLHANPLGDALYGLASRDSHPKEVVELADSKVVRQSVANPWLEPLKLPKQTTITFKARDGVDIQGVLVYPINYSKRKKYPLIMMVHGGPESHVSDAWLDRYSYPIKYAAERDFAVFLPNYRGSTGRGVAFSKMGQADYAGAEFDDLVDAITHLSAIGLVDKERVGITGGSYGGYASAWAATALSEHFAASVMFVGISNQLSKFGTTDIPKEMHNVHARNYPWEKWQWMLERSPIYHTGKAKTPLLIMHGEKDTRVYPGQSMEIYRYIKTRTDTPVRLVFYPDEGHGNKKSAAQLDYSMRLMRWMEFYLKGKKKGKKIPPYDLELSQYLTKSSNISSQ